MNYLNKYWITLIFLGFFLLGASFVWSLFSNDKSFDFNIQILQFDTNVLIPQNLKDHLEEDSIPTTPINTPILNPTTGDPFTNEQN